MAGFNSAFKGLRRFSVETNKNDEELTRVSDLWATCCSIAQITGSEFAVATKFCMLAPVISGFPVWNWSLIQGVGNFKPMPLYTPALAGKSSGYPLNWRLGGRPEPVWKIWRREKSLSLLKMKLWKIWGTVARLTVPLQLHKTWDKYKCVASWETASYDTVVLASLWPLQDRRWRLCRPRLWAGGGRGDRSVVYGGTQTFRDQNSLRVFSDWIPFLWRKAT
jgi:hypothetical protein